MQFGLSESQQILKNNARKFFAAECPMAEVRRLMETETAHDDRLWRKMGAQGFLGVIFPEEMGGTGLGIVELAALTEEMGRALVPGAYLATLLAGAVIDAAGSAAQRQKYLGAISSGDAKSTLALLESGASWDLDSIQMPPLNGEKWFVPDAGVADFIVAVTRSRGELELYIVDGKAVSKTRMPAVDLTRRLYKVAFDNCEGELLARGEAARKALERALDIATVALCAEMTGGMQRTLDIAVDYARTRKQFGKPIGQYQAVQHQCADMLIWTESSRSAAYYAAWALDNSLKRPKSESEARVAVSVAKMYSSDGCREVGNRGIQVQGGMGFTWENDTHLYYRRAKASEIAFGDATFHRERIACLVVDRISVHDAVGVS
jgi:alkylation response protein AidB-like acyl-CoA dehydrogenase